MEWIKKFFKEEEGTEVVEWALAGGLIVAAGAAVFVTIGTEADRLLTLVSDLLSGAAPAPAP
jgi:Flp pilus assembly pilin Flp